MLRMIVEILIKHKNYFLLKGIYHVYVSIVVIHMQRDMQNKYL